MLMRIAVTMALLLAAGLAVVIWSMREQQRGYLAAVFAPDGQSIYAIERDVSATVVGFGYEFWTPPAKVRIHRDRFRLINVRLADGHLSTVQTFPASPLEGTSISAYHGAIFGASRGSLRWADASHLDYAMSVERNDQPASRTFVIQRQWSPDAQRYIEKAPWQEGYGPGGGWVAEQLSGEREVIVPPGDEQLPCAIVVLTTGSTGARVLTDTPTCRKKYRDGYKATTMAAFSSRLDIERVQKMTATYRDLVAQAKARGMNEGEAMLSANKRMQDLGYYPRTPTITAQPSTCTGVSPVFLISDEQFRVGLFQDIERAIRHPGRAEDRSGTYVRHRDYDTSEKLNAYLDARGDATFYVDGLGGCWQLVVESHAR